jgi:ERCC4-related helicase
MTTSGTQSRNAWHPFSSHIRLHVAERISPEDAARQEATAREILSRLAAQPGVILADEVGMGKTFVALAVATSVALADRKKPVVVMVPPSLRGKWPQDAEVFCQKCLPARVASRLRYASADNATDFLKKLDDPADRRAGIIFLTHGAMHRGLSDRWIKLAIIQRALHRRRNVAELRSALHRCLGGLLLMRKGEGENPKLWEELLSRPPREWLKRLQQCKLVEDDDDPVPEAVVRALRDFNTDEIFVALQQIPRRRSVNYANRVTEARRVLNKAIQQLWRECLRNLPYQLPLLIFDEAHHLKNAHTQTASLFQTSESEQDAEEVKRGALGGIFERMLFLTATPFQLGHHELCSVLERFDGICWNGSRAPSIGRAEYKLALAALRESLDAAQFTALNFDAAWGRLSTDNLVVDGQLFDNSGAWWQSARSGGNLTPAGARVIAAYEQTQHAVRAAERVLRPWVIRHLKSRSLPEPFHPCPRRLVLPGKAITNDQIDGTEIGIEVEGAALLPFLLAARAALCSPDTRPVFAEGLASSYEAFLHTRQFNAENSNTPVDTDDIIATSLEVDKRGEWYLDQLEKALPLNDHHDSAAHPKIAATAECVLAAWRQGEKVLVFCHFIATGRALRHVISGRLHDEVLRLGAEKLDCATEGAADQLERLSRRFFDTDSPARRASEQEISTLLREYPDLKAHYNELQEVIRRYLRTPSFLVRYFPLERGELNEESVRQAFSANNPVGLHAMLTHFLTFLAKRCVDSERGIYLDAISRVQTGSMLDRDETLASFSADERQGDSEHHMLLPNVRLANGTVQHETRQRLMLAFNSPFFPEVLIASSVMAEGVDLHRFCRYVIHHDLCWNPSTLEQRTGRVDRIDAKAERSGESIRVYLPYLAATQDEKMFRVVTDRERWFNIVMGEDFKVDARHTEQLAQRVSLPTTIAEELSFALAVRE